MSFLDHANEQAPTKRCEVLKECRGAIQALSRSFPTVLRPMSLPRRHLRTAALAPPVAKHMPERGHTAQAVARHSAHRACSGSVDHVACWPAHFSKKPRLQVQYFVVRIFALNCRFGHASGKQNKCATSTVSSPIT